MRTYSSIASVATRWLRDVSTLQRPTATTFNASTGEEEPGTPDELYADVRCRMRVTRDPREPEFGQTTRTIRWAEWIGPLSVVDVRRDDVVVMTSARDSELIGRWRVVSVEPGGAAPVRKLICRDEP